MTTPENSQEISILSIETKPALDPYHADTEGITYTVLKLDPRDNTIWVCQEYDDNATPAEEWHHLILVWKIQGHPAERDVRDWIVDNMESLQAICAGYEVVWDGSNHVGRLTEDAHAIVQAIDEEFSQGERVFGYTYYEAWNVETWCEPEMRQITADSTDEQLAEIAREWEPSEPDDKIVVLGSILEYITRRRDELRAEQDEDA